MVVWYLNEQLPVQSVPITTTVVHGKVYSDTTFPCQGHSFGCDPDLEIRSMQIKFRKADSPIFACCSLVTMCLIVISTSNFYAQNEVCF
jgi:hypothetical protein